MLKIIHVKKKGSVYGFFKDKSGLCLQKKTCKYLCKNNTVHLFTIKKIKIIDVF